MSTLFFEFSDSYIFLKTTTAHFPNTKMSEWDKEERKATKTFQKSLKKSSQFPFRKSRNSSVLNVLSLVNKTKATTQHKKKQKHHFFFKKSWMATIFRSIFVRRDHKIEHFTRTKRKSKKIIIIIEIKPFSMNDSEQTNWFLPTTTTTATTI